MDGHDCPGTINFPTGKGGRIIVCHAGGANGWVPCKPLIFQSKKTGDYHEEMNAAVFEQWFRDELLPNVPPGTVIVMDNAPYHSRSLAPTSKTPAAEVKAWLRRHNIPFEEDALVRVVRGLAKMYKKRHPDFVVDAMAADSNNRVIRLPPYHCHFNRIEMVWASLKGAVRELNKSHTVNNVQELFGMAIDWFEREEWASSIALLSRWSSLSAQILMTRLRAVQVQAKTTTPTTQMNRTTETKGCTLLTQWR